MRILVLGGTGMLGHRVWIELGRAHEAWVTVQENGNPFPAAPEFPAERVLAGVDGLRPDDLVRALATVRPEVVVNCIGLIKQERTANDPLLAIGLNAMLPHRVAAACRAAGARMVHVSTDCVFSGRRGNYAESDPSDAEDLYGRTKLLGEVGGPGAVTLRTSIIGQGLRPGLGLMEWFLAQAGTVRGFTRHLFTGLTTLQLARVIEHVVLPRPELEGLWQVASAPIDKYHLLLLAKEAYGSPVTIVPDDGTACDRSLDGTRFREATGWTAPPWPEMLREMASHAEFYRRIRGAERA